MKNVKQTFFQTVFLFIAFILSNPSAFAVGPIDFDVFGNGENVGTVHIELKPKGASFGLTGMFSVTKENDQGDALSIEELEAFPGQDHLNWFQKVTLDTHPPKDADGNDIVPPYIDPPINGYSDQWADDIPWYFDEFERPAGEARDWNIDFLLESNVDGSILKYFDFPSDSVVGTTLDFVTFLVSDYGNESYSVLGGFSWSTLTEKNEGTVFTTVTSLIAGANFLQEYAGEIHTEFGWTLVPEPSTILMLGLSLLGFSMGGRRFAKKNSVGI